MYSTVLDLLGRILLRCCTGRRAVVLIVVLALNVVAEYYRVSAFNLALLRDASLAVGSMIVAAGLVAEFKEEKQPQLADPSTCSHDFVCIGWASDTMYREHRLFRCRKCRMQRVPDLEEKSQTEKE